MMRRRGLSITVDEFLKRQGTDTYCLLDVREQREVEIVSLEEALHIPLSTIHNRLDELPQDKEIIVLCHHGIRSLQAAEWLKEQGFESCSLEGGIHAIAKKVGPSMATY